LLPANADAPLVTGCKAGNQLGIELTMTPSSVALPYDAVILASADDAATGNFLLVQRGEWLVLRLKTSVPGGDFPLCKVIPNQPNHLVVSYAPDKLTCYRNGQRVLLRNAVHGDFSTWNRQHLIAGDAWTHEHNWPGLLDGFAIYSRTIDMREAQARYQYRQDKAADHKTARSIVVDAKLTARTTAADPKSIAPYRRCLSVNRYAVVKVIAGECKEETIGVAQWSVLDAKVVPAYEKLTNGQTYRLTIEAWADHPEQESERMMTGDVAGEEPPLYLDVTPLDIPRAAPHKAAALTWTAGDGAWNTAVNWTNGGVPDQGDSVLLDTVAAGTRTVSTRQPVALKELMMNQAKPGGVNTLQLGETLTLTDSTKPLAMTAVEPSGVVLDLHGQPLVCENDTFGDLKLAGTLRLVGNGAIAGITVIDGGEDYTRAPAVSFIGGGGKGAAADALMRVHEIALTKVGAGYTSNPTLIISPPEIAGGRTATAAAYINNVNGAIDRIIITNPGSGYLRAPRVTFTGGGGEGAEVEATLSIAGFFVSDGGSGYAAMPAVVLTGGGGEGAIVQAASQVSQFRYTGRDGEIVFTNAGMIEQDGATLYFDWAAESRNWTRRCFANTGVWTIKNGACLQWISSSGQESWFGRDNTNGGTLRVLSGARLGLQNLVNTGTLELGARVLLGQPVFAVGENAMANTGNGIITVLDGPATFGCAGPSSNGKRVVTNGEAAGANRAQLLIGSGKDAASLTIVGGNCYLDNAATGNLEIRAGATLALTTNDNGSVHKFNNRDARLTNAGTTVIAGKLTLQGNHGGAVSIENSGALNIRGDNAVFERLMSSCGPGGYYSTETGARLSVAPTGTLTGNGTLTYLDKTDSNAARYLSVDVKGIVSPGEKLGEIGKLAFNAVQMRLSGILAITIADAQKCSMLQVSGAGDTGQLTIGPGSILNIATTKDVTPHGTYRIISAKSVSGKFEKLCCNGNNNVPYTVNYLADGVEVVFP